MNLDKSKHIALSFAAGILLLIGLFLMLGSTGQTAPTEPGTLFVKADGAGMDCTQTAPCTLHTALDQSADGDTVYVATGIFTGTGSAVITVTHSITLYGGWDGSPTGDVVRDAKAYPTILDGERQRRVVYISGEITPTLDGFIVTRGNATGLEGTPYNQHVGGGIYSVDASPIIANNVITNNLASSSTERYGRGGGIHLANASATALISGNLVVSNTASTWYGIGGGISTYEGAATVQANHVLSNVACTAGYGGGGGIYTNLGAPRLVNNVIEGNKASMTGGSGGGMHIANVTDAFVQGNLVENNHAVEPLGGSGGGVMVFYSTLTLDSNRVVSNSAESGGGMYISRLGPVTLTNNIIARNQSLTRGGGIRFRGLNESERVNGRLLHNTVADNVGAGVYLESHTALTLTNNIIVSHTTGIYVLTSTIVTADHTLFFGNAMGDVGGAGAITSTDAITGSDPLFADPAGWNYHLRLGSPAIDTGTPVAWLTHDIDGDPRPWPESGDHDIGADEVLWRHVHLPLLINDHPLPSSFVTGQAR